MVNIRKLENLAIKIWSEFNPKEKHKDIDYCKMEIIFRHPVSSKESDEEGIFHGAVVTDDCVKFVSAKGSDTDRVIRYKAGELQKLIKQKTANKL